MGRFPLELEATMIRSTAPRFARSRARLTCPAVLLVLAGLSPTGLRAQSAPPAAPVRPVTDTLHGVAVTDPYRWMEDEGPELDAWLRAQDAYTRAVLERVPEREKILAEMRALLTDAAVVSQVRRLGDRLVYLKRNAGEQVAKLYLREGATGSERVLVDPAALGDGTRRFTIGRYALSPDGRYLAFGSAPGGSEIGSIRVVEVATGRTLPDTIGRAHAPDWHPDGRLAYARLRDLPPDAPPGSWSCAGPCTSILSAPIRQPTGL
jgi:prolyl oligopeptidase